MSRGTIEIEITNKTSKQKKSAKHLKKKRNKQTNLGKNIVEHNMKIQNVGFRLQ